MATLSLCMIVKDEEGFLEDCLNSVKDIVDETIIIDTGSKDNTKSIADKAGAKIFDFKWKDDFSKARNFSLEKATSNWILVLDADELLDEEGKKTILELINNKEHALTSIIGFKMDQRSYHPKENTETIPTTDQNELKEMYEGHTSSKLIRLFKNNPKIRFRNKVHELVEHSIKENDGKIIETNIAIHHFGHLKKDKLHTKAQDYVDIMWKQLKEDPENPRYNRQVGLAFLEKGDKERAMKYLLRTLKLDPKYPGILADLAKLYTEMGNIPKAIKFFNFAIATDKKDTASMNNLAVIYMNLKKYDIARRLLETALKLEPENKCVLDNLDKVMKKKHKD